MCKSRPHIPMGKLLEECITKLARGWKTDPISLNDQNLSKSVTIILSSVYSIVANNVETRNQAIS